MPRNAAPRRRLRMETAMPKVKTRKTLSKIDEELDESFPASDPPAFMGGNHIIGAPPRRKKKARKASKAEKPKIKRAKKKKAAKKRR
jgi:hypothetical protein